MQLIDDHQVDLKSKADSGFRFLYAVSRRVKNMEGVTLQQNHRDPIVDELIEIYNEAEDRGIIKSLGSWGGDFILVSGEKQDLSYFKQKGYDTIFNFEDLVYLN